MLSNRHQQSISILINVLVVLFLVIGVKQAIQAYYLAHPQPTNISERSFTVSGLGDVVGIPDVATFTVGVVEENVTVAEVTNAGNITMKQVVESIKQKGVSDADIKTTTYNLSPRYTSLVSPKVIAGYRLDQTVQVKVRDLEKVAEIVDAATEAGANSVGSPSFEIDDPESLKNEARAEAFAQAKEKAESLAALAGVQLGEVISFSEDQYGPLYGESYLSYAESDSLLKDLEEPTFETGSQEVTMNVSVTYSIQ